MRLFIETIATALVALTGEPVTFRGLIPPSAK
jgi:hypothetical protein